MIFSLVLFVIFIWGGVEQPEEIDKKYTKDKFVSLRAILAMLVVFGHTFLDDAYGIAVLDKLLLLLIIVAFYVRRCFPFYPDMVCTNRQKTIVIIFNIIMCG